MFNKIKKVGNITRINSEAVYSLEVTYEELIMIKDAVSLYNDKLIRDYNKTSLNPTNIDIKRKQLHIYNKICNLKLHIDSFLHNITENALSYR